MTAPCRLCAPRCHSRSCVVAEIHEKPRHHSINNLSHSREKAANRAMSRCFGILPPRGFLINNIRGNNRDNFHPRHWMPSSRRSAPFTISCNATRNAERKATQRNLGGDHARRLKMLPASTVSKLRNASRIATLMVTSSTGSSGSEMTDCARSAAVPTQRPLPSLSQTCA